MVIGLECRNPTFDFGPEFVEVGERDNRFLRMDVDQEKPAMRFFPNGADISAAPSTLSFAQWDSNFRTRYASPSFQFITAFGTYEQEMSGFIFANAFFFNHQATYQNATGFAANFGPIFTLLDQPLIRAQGSARTMSIYNGVRSQPRLGPHLAGGTLALTSMVLYESAGTIAAGTTVTTRTCFRAGGPAITGGTVTTAIGFDVPDPGIGTTRIGIRGLIGAGAANTFIDHQGTARSQFAGDIHMNNGVSLVLGSDGANRVELLRSAAGVMRQIGQGGTNNEALEWDFDQLNNIEVTSSTGAGLQLNTDAISAGQTSADPSSNWQFIFSPGAQTISVAGEFSRVLFTAAANVTVDAVLSNLWTFTMNEPGATIGAGSVTDAGILRIQTAPGFGTNRYGLLITSNPTGGTLNYAFRQSNSAARARFDGLLDINRGVALGSSGVATLGATATTAESGPQNTAQAQWLEIEIGGTSHFIPVWT